MQAEKKPDPDIEAPQESSPAVEPQAEPVGGKNVNRESTGGEFLSDERAFDEDAFDESELDEPASSEEGTIETLEAPHTALVINVQSWATPIVGLLMLVIGLLGGYFGRPLLNGPAAPAGSAALTSPVPAVTASASEANPTANAADRASLMEFLVSQTRHFKGDPQAPVTLIEFSDFQ